MEDQAPNSEAELDPTAPNAEAEADAPGQEQAGREKTHAEVALESAEDALRQLKAAQRIPERKAGSATRAQRKLQQAVIALRDLVKR